MNAINMKNIIDEFRRGLHPASDGESRMIIYIHTYVLPLHSRESFTNSKACIKFVLVPTQSFLSIRLVHIDSVFYDQFYYRRTIPFDYIKITMIIYENSIPLSLSS